MEPFIYDKNIYKTGTIIDDINNLFNVILFNRRDYADPNAYYMHTILDQISINDKELFKDVIRYLNSEFRSKQETLNGLIYFKYNNRMYEYRIDIDLKEYKEIKKDDEKDNVNYLLLKNVINTDNRKQHDQFNYFAEEDILSDEIEHYIPFETWWNKYENILSNIKNHHDSL